MKPLFELAAEYRAIAQVLMDTNADEQTLADTLEAEQWPLEQKCQNYGFVIRNLHAQEMAELAEAERMLARATATKKRREALEKRLFDALTFANVTEPFVYPQFTIGIGKKTPAVEITDEAALPDEYLRWSEPVAPQSAPDKKEIAKAIKAGKEVPGAKLVNATKLVIT